MAVTLRKAFGAIAPNATSAVLTVDTGAAPVIAVDDVVVVAALRSIAGTLVGLASLTDSDGNAYAINRANSVRASAYELSLSLAKVTNALEANDPLTVTFRNSASRMVGAAAAFTGLTGEVGAASPNTVIDGTTSVGLHGPANPVSATLTVPTAGSLVVAAVGMGSAGNTFTPTAGQGWVSTPIQGTSYGSADRNVQLFYKIAPAVGAVPFGGTFATSASWVAAMASFTPAEVLPPSGGGGSAVVGGIKRPVVARSVIVGGVKKTVVGTWMVVGGVKRPVV